MSLSVLTRLSRSTVHFPFLFTTQANVDSSTLIFLVTGSSSDCCSSETDIGGLGERCMGLKAPPLLAAAPALASWLSMVAMNEPKAASDLDLLSPSAFVSFDWIST